MCCAILNKEFKTQKGTCNEVNICKYCGKVIIPESVEDYDCTMQKIQNIKKRMRDKWARSNAETVRLYKQYAKSTRVFDDLEMSVGEKLKHFVWLKEREKLDD